MSSALVRRFTSEPHLESRLEPADGTIVVLPDQLTQVRLLAPGPLPDGAVVLGLVVAVPGGGDSRPVRQLVAVPSGGAPSPDTTTTAHHPDPPAGSEPSPGRRLLQCPPGLTVDLWERRVVSHGREVTLTRREFQLLEHLMTHPGRVFTRSQLLAAVWDFDDPRLAPARTVDVHVSRLRRKLGPEHSRDLQSLRGVGYRWSGRRAPVADPIGDVG